MKWKRKLVEESVKIFEGDASKQEKSTDKEVEINELYRQIEKIKGMKTGASPGCYSAPSGGKLYPKRIKKSSS